MAQVKKEYVIPFVGLKIGTHEFEFNVTDEFFEGIEYSIVHKGNINVKLTLEKKETMMIGNFVLEGTVGTDCDLCNDPVEVDIEGEYQLIYKFDDQPSNDETLIVVYPDEFEIDVKENILELISVSLPSRSIHAEGECNEEMIEILDEYRVNADSDSDDDLDEEDATEEDELGDDDGDDDDYIDPRWEALKGLK